MVSLSSRASCRDLEKAGRERERTRGGTREQEEREKIEIFEGWFIFSAFTKILSLFFRLLLFAPSQKLPPKTVRAMPGKEGGKAKVSSASNDDTNALQSERGAREKENRERRVFRFRCLVDGPNQLNAKILLLLSTETQFPAMLQPLKKPKSNKADLDDDDLAFKAKQREVSFMTRKSSFFSFRPPRRSLDC